MGYVTSQKLINYDFPTDIQATLQEWFGSLPWIFSVVFGRRASPKGYSEMLVFFCCMGHHRDTCKYSGPLPRSFRRRPWEFGWQRKTHVFLLNRQFRPIFSGSLNKYPEWKITSSLLVPYLGWLDNLEKGIRYWFFMIFQLPGIPILY